MMETVGRKLSHRFFLKSLKVLTASHGPKLAHSKVIPTNTSVLRNVVKPNHWSLNLKTCNSPSNYIRHLHVSCIRSSEDSEDPAKQGKYNDMLRDDVELQNILKDIIIDFNDSSPTNDPPKATKQEDQTEAAAAVSSKPCETCGSISNNMPHSIEGQFKVFDESQTEEILDYDEEQQKGNFYLYQEKEDPLSQYDFKRGKEGVYDIEELVNVLQQENASDVVVISVPDHLHYCKYLVLVTARSPRHLKALSLFINKLYKRKKAESDPFIIPEGKDSQDWKVLDMGQIVLHMFLESTRKHYDLETLWTVGEEYDDLSNTKQDPVLDLLQEHIQYLDDIEPLSVSEKQ